MPNSKDIAKNIVVLPNLHYIAKKVVYFAGCSAKFSRYCQECCIFCGTFANFPYSAKNVAVLPYFLPRMLQFYCTFCQIFRTLPRMLQCLPYCAKYLGYCRQYEISILPRMLKFCGIFAKITGYCQEWCIFAGFCWIFVKSPEIIQKMLQYLRYFLPNLPNSQDIAKNVAGLAGFFTRSPGYCQECCSSIGFLSNFENIVKNVAVVFGFLLNYQDNAKNVAEILGSFAWLFRNTQDIDENVEGFAGFFAKSPDISQKCYSSGKIFCKITRILSWLLIFLA